MSTPTDDAILREVRILRAYLGDDARDDEIVAETARKLGVPEARVRDVIGWYEGGMVG